MEPRWGASANRHHQAVLNETIRVRREAVRQDLQGDLAVELRVGRLPDLAHAAFPEKGGDVVASYALESHWIRPETVPQRYSLLGVAEAGAGGQGHEL